MKRDFDVRFWGGMIVFLASFVCYAFCVQPTLSFWDCGEFAAAMVHQQVPHPPGAPLFLMLGKVFHLIPFGDVILRINYISVVASAATVWLLYQIIIMTLRVIDWEDESGAGASAFEMRSSGHSASLIHVMSALIGSLAFCFSDTFWFNAVESEVYALSTLLVALVTYLLLRWSECADEKGNERYLLLMAYVVGLSLGVHLLSVLTLLSVGLIIAMRRYVMTLRAYMISCLVVIAAFVLVYPGIVRWLPLLLAGNLPFANIAGEHVVHDAIAVRAVGLLLLVVPFVGTWFCVRTRKTRSALAFASIALVLIGYSTYTHILIRAKAQPPMNENAPTSMRTLSSYVAREQYGNAPMFPRRYESDEQFVQAYRKYGPYTPPRVASIPSERNPGVVLNVPDYSGMRMTSADWKYMFSYQLDHMFLRYLLWNFFGRVSDAQDADAWTYLTATKSIQYQTYGIGYDSLFPAVYWGLPFLLGCWGCVRHFRRDARHASAFMLMFVMMGVVAAFAQNQQEPQPRERDYFYTGAFMVFAIWIGIGTWSILGNAAARLKGKAVIAVSSAVILLAVPLNMAWSGWGFHSRAGNYLAYDYAYNLLQSCDKDAVLFTNGDNDTFTLWALQDVYGIRRDIRVVNLSLANALWYIKQLQTESPWGAKPLPLTFPVSGLESDELSDKALQNRIGPAVDHYVQLGASAVAAFALPDSVREMKWRCTGYARGGSQFLFTRAQQVVEQCVLNSHGERPLYFAVTCGYPTSELYCGLGAYCKQEGMTYRVWPVVVGEPGEVIDEEAMSRNLLSTRSAESVRRDASPGFILRNLHDEHIYYDEIQRRYVDNYRTLYIRAAQYCVQRGDSLKARRYLHAMNDLISLKVFPMSYALMSSVADFAEKTGDKEMVALLDADIIRQCELLLQKPFLQRHVEIFLQGSPPAMVAAQSSLRQRKYDDALRYVGMAEQSLASPSVAFMRAMIEASRKKSEGDVVQARAILEQYLQRTAQAGDAVSADARTKVNATLDSWSVSAP